MNKKSDLYKKRYELYDSLFEEKNLDEILGLVEKFLGNPIFILDTSYRIITRSPYAKADNSSIETRNGENYLVLAIISLMKEKKCIDAIYKSNNSFFHYSDQNLIFCSIKVNHITIGYISVLESKRGFQDEDLELTNILSKVLSIQIQKESLFISNSGLDEEYYLIDLLKNGVDNVQYAEERLKQGHFILNKNLLMLSIPYRQQYKDYRHNFGLRQLIQNLKNIFGNCISTYYDDNIIFLVGSECKQVISENILKNLLEFLDLNNLRCGISIAFQNLSDIKDYFNQSVYALRLSSHVKSDKPINFFEDYIEYYLFSMASNSSKDLYRINLLTLVHPWIKELMEFDKENNAELLKTLETYLESNRNANETSHKLNIHRSTFFYRFNKIKSLLQMDLEDSKNLSKLELSLKILSYI